MIKKLDILLVRSFLPPFVVTFFIALFVFVMQTLWLYIDNIAGKGVGFFLLIELVAYMSVSMVPMALPVAVLISSVMVLGNMAEQYELSSFKSAGISLWRVMRPLMMVTACIGIFSFFCSNYLLPISNLKFKSRLHDIKNQKPALSLEESLFNDDFKGYAIRIGDKSSDNQTIKDVMLYDNTKTNSNQMMLIAADSGSMFGSEDGNFFVMQLYDGSQISEPKPSSEKGKRNYPLMRANFKQWTKVFNLDEFDLDRTDEGLFKSHHSMLSNRQLLDAIDSIDVRVGERVARFEQQTNRHFHFIDKEWQKKQAEKRKIQTEKERLRENWIKSPLAKTVLKQRQKSRKKRNRKKHLPKRRKHPRSQNQEYQLKRLPRNRNQNQSLKNPLRKHLGNKPLVESYQIMNPLQRPFQRVKHKKESQKR